MKVSQVEIGHTMRYKIYYNFESGKVWGIGGLETTLDHVLSGTEEAEQIVRREHNYKPTDTVVVTGFGRV